MPEASLSPARNARLCAMTDDPHFARKLASIRSLDELHGFATYRDFNEAERQAIALRRAELQRGRG